MKRLGIDKRGLTTGTPSPNALRWLACDTSPSPPLVSLACEYPLIQAAFDNSVQSQFAIEGTNKGRLASLDAFRGLTILAMILVDKPGSWDHLYWPLAHAEWHGWTLTDLVFPFFIYIVGSSLAFSLRRYWHDGQAVSADLYKKILRRTLVLMALGMALNHFQTICEYLCGGSQSLDLTVWRYPGVLQRIALVYLITSMIVLHVGVRRQIATAFAILLGYWGLLAWFPDPGNSGNNYSPSGNLVRQVDQAIFGVDHLYTQGTIEKTDPEGFLSTLPAVVTGLFGYWTARFVQLRRATARTVVWLLAAGICATGMGLWWGTAFPISKKLWTSSFVVLTGGLATMTFAACLLLFDVCGWRRAADPLKVVGINAIFVYVASWVVEVLLDTLEWQGRSLKSLLFGSLFSSWIQPTQLASLSFAVVTVCFWWSVVWLMSLRGWKITV